MLSLTDVRERISCTGAMPVGGTPREFDAIIAAKQQRPGNMVSKAEDFAGRLQLRGLYKKRAPGKRP